MRSMRRRIIVFAVCALLMMTLISAAFATSVHANSIAEANVCDKTETDPFCFSFQKQSGNQRIGAFGQNHSNPVRAYYTVPKLTVNVKVIIDNYTAYKSVLAENPGFSFSMRRSVDLVDLSSSIWGWSNSMDNFPTPYTFVGTEEITWEGGEGSKEVTFDPVDAYGKLEDLLWFEPSASTNEHFSINQIVIEKSSGVTAKPFKCKTNSNTEVTAFNCIRITNHSNSGNNQVNLVLRLKYNPGIEGKEPPPEPETKYSKTIKPYDNQKNAYRLSLSLDTPVPDKEEPEKDVIFVLDVSSSMEKTFGDGPSRLHQLQNVLTNPDCGVVDVLAKSDKNRMHVITFGSRVSRLEIDPKVSESAEEIKDAIKKITIEAHPHGGTNYYNALSETGRIIGELGASSEKIVFFITDGKPTAAYPAANIYYGTADQYYPASIFARYAAQALTVDRFYSIFVGGNDGEASDLQTITQAVKLNASNPESEKFMIQADSSTELNSALQRFLSFLNNALHDVVIEDQISEYLDYAGNACVTATTKTSSGGVTETTLIKDKDYTLSTNGNKVTMKLVGYTLPGTTYTLSFDVKANRNALEYYYENADVNGDGIVDSAEEIYPDTGDAGTGINSSGQPGLKSNSGATLKYSYGVDKTETKTYPHPVFQVDADPAKAEIRLTKELIGRTLEEGEFLFQLYDKNGNAVGDPVANDANGEIVFQDLSFAKSGEFDFTVKELIPEEPNRTIDYDVREIPVKVKVFFDNATNMLDADVTYPSGTTFTNVYHPEPVEVTIETEKILEGHIALKPGMFSFELMEEGGKRLETVSNGADGVVGKIKYTPLVLDEPGVYRFIIQEAIPIPQDPNIRYDMFRTFVTVEVKDNNGKLEAEVSYSRTAFINKYVTPPVNAQIEIPTILTGRRLTTGAFQYKLAEYNEEDGTIGKEVAEAINSIDGLVRFDSIQFDEPTEHTYIAWQVEPEEPISHMTYDTKQIIVHLLVEADEENGQLTATTEYFVKDDENAEPLFFNIYHIRGRIW